MLHPPARWSTHPPGSNPSCAGPHGTVCAAGLRIGVFARQGGEQHEVGIGSQAGEEAFQEHKGLASKYET